MGLVFHEQVIRVIFSIQYLGTLLNQSFQRHSRTRRLADRSGPSQEVTAGRHVRVEVLLNPTGNLVAN